MFFLIGLLIMGALGTVCLGCLVAASKAATSKRKGAALAYCLPVVLIICAVAMLTDDRPEDDPEETFAKIFKVEPTAQVTKMRVYNDGDELWPVFLQFHAPPALAQKLLRSRFHPASKKLAIEAMEDAKRVTIPQWFNTKIAPDAQVFQLNGSLGNSEDIAIYDSKINRVRVYFNFREALSRS